MGGKKQWVLGQRKKGREAWPLRVNIRGKSWQIASVEKGEEKGVWIGIFLVVFFSEQKQRAFVFVLAHPGKTKVRRRKPFFSFKIERADNLRGRLLFCFV